MAKYEYEFFDKEDQWGMPVATVKANNAEQAWRKLVKKVTGSEAFPRRPTLAQVKEQLTLGGKTRIRRSHS